jgi:ABC-2 type transport system ATP-binding protein
MVLRLIFPTKGSIRIFGASPEKRESLQRLGYLPENPYVYQYLKPLEFLDLCGRLTDMKAADRKKRSRELVERVGLADAADRPIGKFSKGMMQRIGLAQALLHDPELLILDEPMSGLDPIGRKEVRDVLVEERKKGRTLLFTSHILSDVEMLCDRVAIMNHGKITAEGRLDELLRPEVRRVEIVLASVSPELRDQIGGTEGVEPGELHLVVEGDDRVPDVLRAALDGGAKIVSVIPQRETLEELFLREALKGGR